MKVRRNWTPVRYIPSRCDFTRNEWLSVEPGRTSRGDGEAKASFSPEEVGLSTPPVWSSLFRLYRLYRLYEQGTACNLQQDLAVRRHAKHDFVYLQPVMPCQLYLTFGIIHIRSHFSTIRQNHNINTNSNQPHGAESFLRS
jgi:hypothetical protein